MTITGTITKILSVESGMGKNNKEWHKGGFVIQTNEQYPKTVCISLFGNILEDFDARVGQQVTAEIDVESREFNGRWYSDVKAWKVVVIS